MRQEQETVQHPAKLVRADWGFKIISNHLMETISSHQEGNYWSAEHHLKEILAVTTQLLQDYKSVEEGHYPSVETSASSIGGVGGSEV